MVHGKVLRSPVPHARIVSIDVSRRRGDAGRGRGSDSAPSSREFEPLLGPRDQGPPDPRHRAGPLRRRAGGRGRRRGRGDRRGGAARDRRRLRGAAGGRHASTEALADDAPLLHEGELRPGLFHGLGKLAEREGNVCYRYRLDAGSVERAEADADAHGRGRVRVPRRLPVRDGDPHRGRRVRAATSSRSGPPASTRSWSAPSSPTCSSCRSGAVRVIVPYLGGGFGSKSYTKMEPVTAALRLEGGAAGADPEPRRRVDGDHPPPRDALPDADHRERGRQARLAQRAAAGSTPAPTPTTARASAPPPATPRPAPTLGRGPRRRQLRLHQHLARGLLPRLRRRAPAVDRRDAGRRARPPRRDRSARDPAAQPAAPGRAGAPGRTGKPLDADLVGDVEKAAAAIGWDEPKRRVERARGRRRAARRRRPPGLAARTCGWRPTAASRSTSGPPRWARGRAR